LSPFFAGNRIKCPHCKRALERNGFGPLRLERGFGIRLRANVAMTYVCRDRTAAAVVCSGAAPGKSSVHFTIWDDKLVETLPPVIVASFSSVFSKKAIISTELVTLLSTLREYGVTFATMNRAATETVATALLDLDSLRIAKWHHRRSNPVFVRGSAIQTPRLDCSLPTCMLAVATDRMKMAYKLNAKTGELPATSILEGGGMVAAVPLAPGNVLVPCASTSQTAAPPSFPTANASRLRTEPSTRAWLVVPAHVAPATREHSGQHMPCPACGVLRHGSNECVLYRWIKDNSRP
jgi:hypothetical protein